MTEKIIAEVSEKKENTKMRKRKIDRKEVASQKSLKKLMEMVWKKKDKEIKSKWEKLEERKKKERMIRKESWRKRKKKESIQYKLKNEKNQK